MSLFLIAHHQTDSPNMGQLLMGSLVFTPKNNPSRFFALRNAIVNGHWIKITGLLPLVAGDHNRYGLKHA